MTPNRRPAFLVRLIAPRPSFLADMTPEEMQIMAAHAEYWSSNLGGAVVAFGPVADPSGAWGLGLLQLPDEAAVKAYEAKDPAIKADVGFRYEVMAMPTLVTRD